MQRRDRPGLRRQQVGGQLLPLVFFLASIRGPGRPPISADPEETLTSPTRRAIYVLVRAHPGLSASEIKRALELGGGSVHHHLRKLEAAGLVVVRDVDGQLHVHLPRGVPAARDAALDHPALRRVAEAVLAAPGLGSEEYAEATGLPRRVAAHYLSQLAAADWLGRREVGRSVRYFPLRSLHARLTDARGRSETSRVPSRSPTGGGADEG